MNRAVIGILWGMFFVILDSVQFVFFGGLFQRMNSFLFGSLVLGITTVAFVGWGFATRPAQMKIAFANPRLLIAINVTATLGWAAFLSSVQLIEPAVAYTIGAGIMPITTYIAYRCGVPEGEAMRSRTEAAGNMLVFVGIVVLCVITISGWSGFVRGGSWIAAAGLVLAVADGVFFTWLLIYCQRMDRVGVSPGAVFGLRFPLYVIVAGGMAAAGVGQKETLSLLETSVIVLMGLALTIPPLYALQRAVAHVSTLTISTLTALGPFVIFGLQMIEGRVEYAPATLVGLFIYFIGALVAAFGAVQASATPASATPP